MAKRVQLRRGTTDETNAFTGAVGEVTADTTKAVLVYHDGATAGGYANAARADTDGNITFIGRNNTWLGSLTSTGVLNVGTTNTTVSQASKQRAGTGGNIYDNGYTFKGDDDTGFSNPADGVLDTYINGNIKERHYGNSTYSTVYGSYAGLYPQFQCRAWVNFWGTGAVGIRGAGNVSSIGDNGVGDYTIWLAETMPDACACIIGMGETSWNQGGRSLNFNADTTAMGNNYCRVYHRQGNQSNNVDASWLSLAFFR